MYKVQTKVHISFHYTLFMMFCVSDTGRVGASGEASEVEILSQTDSSVKPVLLHTVCGGSRLSAQFTSGFPGFQVPR